MAFLSGKMLQRALDGTVVQNASVALANDILPIVLAIFERLWTSYNDQSPIHYTNERNRCDSGNVFKWAVNHQLGDNVAGCTKL